MKSYVITEELRDGWLADLVEADTDAHKSSQALGSGIHIENCQLCMGIAELRAAPETVSLEGMPEGTESARIWWTVKGENPESRIEVPGPDIFDLRRLVAPVQPSAVVSRQGACPKCGRLVHWSDYEGNPADTLLCPQCYHQWPTPQPVAPVQSGGCGASTWKVGQ